MDNHQKGNNTVVEALFDCCLGLILPVTFIWPFEIKRLVCCFFFVFYDSNYVCVFMAPYIHIKKIDGRKSKIFKYDILIHSRSVFYIYNLGNQERQNPIFVCLIIFGFVVCLFHVSPTKVRLYFLFIIIGIILVFVLFINSTFFIIIFHCFVFRVFILIDLMLY